MISKAVGGKKARPRVALLIRELPLAVEENRSRLPPAEERAGPHFDLGKVFEKAQKWR